MTYNDQYPILPGPLRPADPIFVKLETLKVEDIFKYQLSKFIYKCLNHLVPGNFENWFKLNHNIHEYRTRCNYNIADDLNINNLFIPLARTANYGLKQLRVNGPRIWNAVPTHIRNEKSLNVFLRKLKSHLISGYG